MNAGDSDIASVSKLHYSRATLPEALLRSSLRNVSRDSRFRISHIYLPPSSRKMTSCPLHIYRDAATLSDGVGA
jgi:hypothetical protein